VFLSSYELGLIFHKTAFFTVTAVKISNLTRLNIFLKWNLYIHVRALFHGYIYIYRT
jgi:hypothetical protein